LPSLLLLLLLLSAGTGALTRQYYRPWHVCRTRTSPSPSSLSLSLVRHLISQAE